MQHTSLITRDRRGHLCLTLILHAVPSPLCHQIYFDQHFLFLPCSRLNLPAPSPSLHCLSVIFSAGHSLQIHVWNIDSTGATTALKLNACSTFFSFLPNPILSLCPTCPCLCPLCPCVWVSDTWTTLPVFFFIFNLFYFKYWSWSCAWFVCLWTCHCPFLFMDR